ncbi:MAG: cyclic peptide transporter, partial [Cytophagales bacterium]|nr:cyclic peptide transporter [Cytophagales bacterium]
MNLSAILSQKSKLFYCFILVLGGINSLFYSGVLIVINKAVVGEPLPVLADYNWLVFTVMILASYATGKLLQSYMIRLSQDMVFNLEISLLERLRRACYEDFSRLGQEKIYTAFTDTRILAYIPETLISMFNALIILGCGLGYMFWVAPVGALGVLGLMVILLVVYLLRNKSIEADLQAVRELQNDYFRYLRDFIFGFRELKMSTAVSRNIYDKFLKQNRDKAKVLSLRTATKYMNNELFGNLSWYAVLGLVLFALPRVVELDLTQLLTFVVSILYLMKPVLTLIVGIPQLTRIKVAFARISR